MRAPARVVAAIVVTAAWTGSFVVAQGGGAPAPQGQGQPPAAQPAPGRGQQPPAPPGAGAGAAGRQGAPAPGRGRAGGYTQFTRPLASQDVLVRGRAVYEQNCASCHAVDLRGTADGKNPNLLRSGVALRDQHGELIGARVSKHTPPINLIPADMIAAAEYIHSVHATMSGQGSPPGRYPQNLALNVLVGDAKAGQAQFAQRCASCHSVTGDLGGIASKLSEPRALQNGWVSGSTSVFGGRGGGRGGGGAPVPATVTLANGTTVDGMLLREDDFLVVLQLADGTRRSFARTDGVPRVEIKDPRAGHVDAIVKLAHEDRTSKMMHDITAYLSTIK
jgi:cytochrome c oxidase cbb3-type subunit 3